MEALRVVGSQVAQEVERRLVLDALDDRPRPELHASHVRAAPLR
jgi:hypothetical protein